MHQPPPEAIDPSVDPSSSPGTDTRGHKSVPVRYEHTGNLAAVLHQLELSLVITTYQAGRVVSVGSNCEQLQISFAHLPQAMGLTRTPTGLAIGSREAVWSFPASRDLAPSIRPEGTHDIAFLARTAHHSGQIMGHDLAWCGDRLWGVNTLFNCLCTFEAPWSFLPRWRPRFISSLQPGDRCHLNGLAALSDGSAPAYVTALGESDSENGWRANKATGGCLIEVASGEVVLRGLSMPHSPRLHRGSLYLLDSGHGRVLRWDPGSAEPQVICELPGFTRGLDCFGDVAVVGLSRIRETAVFGGLPLQERGEELRCGVALVDLTSGDLLASLWFESGVEEVFAVCLLPGYRNPALLGPDTDIDASQTVWMVPAEERAHEAALTHPRAG